MRQISNMDKDTGERSDEGHIFERCLVWTICQKANESGVSKNDTELALEGFKDVNHPVNAWRSVRNGSADGKFRGVTIEEAFNLAKAIGMTLPQLCWDVENHIRNGWSLAQDISHEKGKAGRPPKIKDKNCEPDIFPESCGTAGTFVPGSRETLPADIENVR